MPLFSQHSPQQNGAATLLRRYRPLETRATGGFGSVEICLDTRLQRRVAIKRIPLVAEGMPAPAGSTAAALGLTFVFVLPAAVLIAGAVVVLLRRRR